MRLLVFVLGAVLLAGCGAESAADPAAAPTTAPVEAPPAPDPTAITIPAIDAHSTLIPLGLTAEGALDVPPVDNPMQAGWYAGADPYFDGDEYQPGEVGPAVIAGHVDGVIAGRKGQPGIFHRLRELKQGDEVLVDREDGSRLRFLVERVERHSKNDFPTEQVYGPTTRPELRLITCGGEWDPKARHYRDNWVVWAALA